MPQKREEKRSCLYVLPTCSHRVQRFQQNGNRKLFGIMEAANNNNNIIQQSWSSFCNVSEVTLNSKSKALQNLTHFFYFYSYLRQDLAFSADLITADFNQL